MHFVYAVDGAIIADFDPLMDRDARCPAIAPALDGLQFGLFGAESSALSLLARLTGVQVASAWLAARHPAVALPPLG
jgi:hypothetical protein